MERLVGSEESLRDLFAVARSVESIVVETKGLMESVSSHEDEKPPKDNLSLSQIPDCDSRSLPELWSELVSAYQNTHVIVAQSCPFLSNQDKLSLQTWFEGSMKLEKMELLQESRALQLAYYENNRVSVGEAKLSRKAREILRDAFRAADYPDAGQLQKLSKQCGLSLNQTKIWFQNQRSRRKARRKQDAISALTPSSSDLS